MMSLLYTKKSKSSQIKKHCILLSCIIHVHFQPNQSPPPQKKKTKNMFYKNLKFSWVNILLGKKIKIIGSISTCLVIITVNPSET